MTARVDWSPELLAVSPVRLSADSIIADAAGRHGITSEDITGRLRLKHIVAARAEVCLRLRAQQWSYPAIARVLDRDHSTVMALVRAWGSSR